MCDRKKENCFNLNKFSSYPYSLDLTSIPIEYLQEDVMFFYLCSVSRQANYMFQHLKEESKH